MQSCFTGIESTPKITANELKRQHISVTPEQQFMSELSPERPAEWKPGKRFFVSDGRISLIFTAASSGTDSLASRVIEFCHVDSVTSVDSHGAAELVFRLGSDTMRYRPGLEYTDLMSRKRFDVPFTIDLDLVDKVRALMAGNHYWITASRWYDPLSRQPIADSRRYVPVTITDVRPGNPSQPLLVVFRPDAPADTSEQAVFMTVGDDRLAIRNFDTLFSFTDVRRRYPSITDHVWDLITRSRVEEGMTRDECRLSIGAPLQIIHGSGTSSMLERWTYADGVYLIFDDGLLTRFRI